MTIRVLSFDFDGCLFNHHYLTSQEKDVLTSNAAFLDKIKQENLTFTKAYTFIGSNRQSRYVDVINSKKSGSESCFPAIKKVSDFLGTTLDPFILADIYGDAPDGISFAQAIDNDYRGAHNTWMFDESKVTPLYAQIHKMANANPNEKIIFDFYDDRGNNILKKQMLEKLNDFFSKNPNLIPSNVTLRLNHYIGWDVTEIATIKGIGFIDVNYRKTVKDLAQQAVAGSNNGVEEPLNVYDHAKPELLANRIALSEKIISDKVKFTAALNAIAKKAKELGEDGDKLYNIDASIQAQSDVYYSYKNAARAVHQLHTKLSNAYIAYSVNRDELLFKKTTDDAIKKAMNSELKNHRGHLKQILGYAGLAVLAVLTIATAGLAYAIAGGINYAVNRQFFFSTTLNTDSMNKVLDLQEAIDVLTASPAA
ncbi:MAG: hypothetical protein P4L65_08915 [Legionella sp.]|nr:hypothetical protein [Legionella sp.]